MGEFIKREAEELAKMPKADAWTVGTNIIVLNPDAKIMVNVLGEEATNKYIDLRLFAIK